METTIGKLKKAHKGALNLVGMCVGGLATLMFVGDDLVSKAIVFQNYLN